MRKFEARMLFATAAAVSFGILIGFLRGGNLTRLAQLPVRLFWLGGLAWLLQVVLFASPLADRLDMWAAPIHLATVALVGAVIVANRALPGLALVGVGLLLNAVVYTANGGFMPVSENALLAIGNSASLDAMRSGERIQKAFLMRAESPLWFLGDVLPFSPFGKVYSVGDVIAAFGALVVVVQGMGSKAQSGGSGDLTQT
jgi:hypothetical protein